MNARLSRLWELAEIWSPSGGKGHKLARQVCSNDNNHDLRGKWVKWGAGMYEGPDSDRINRSAILIQPCGAIVKTRARSRDRYLGMRRYWPIACDEAEEFLQDLIAHPRLMRHVYEMFSDNA